MRTKRLIIIFSILLSLTLIIAIGSAVFSIRRVDAFCYNSDDAELTDRIVNGKYDGKKSIKDMLTGKSIYALNESDLISEVESREGGIKVINIERLFPNRVSINFIRLYEYFEIMFGDKYYYFGSDGKITGVNDEHDPGYIRIIMNLSAEPVSGGDIIGEESYAHLAVIIDMAERLGYRGVDAAGIIEFIDFEKKSNYTYIKMRSGVYFEISGYNNLGEKFRSALSVYNSDASVRLSGTIIVGESDKLTYSPKNRYEEDR